MIFLDFQDDLITTYGFFGFTKVLFHDGKLKNLNYSNRNENPNPYHSETNSSYEGYENMNTEKFDGKNNSYQNEKSNYYETYES